jgi:hypothetical protein
MGVLYNTAQTGFLVPINNSVDKIMAASNGLMCIKNALLNLPLNPSMLMQGLAGVAAGMIASITSAVTKIIINRARQIIGAVLAPLRQIETILIDIIKTLLSIQDLIERATNMDNYFQDKQQCANMGAHLLNCLAQAVTEKVTAKVAMKVDKEVAKIANQISSEAMKVNGSITKFVDRQASFLNKYSLQNKLL